jgi:hypothetical protein
MKLQEVTINELELLEAAMQGFVANELSEFHKRMKTRRYYYLILKFIPFTKQLKLTIQKEELSDLALMDAKLGVVTQFYIKIHAATGYDDDMKPVTYAAMKGINIIE